MERMNDIEIIEHDLRTRFPGATVTVDAPSDPGGAWYVDVRDNHQDLTIQWRRDRGFGVSATSGEYGEGAEEIYSTIAQVENRVAELLQPTQWRSSMAGKGDVINEIAEQAGISKKEAAAAFDAFVRYISNTCQSAERCAIPGLGSFAVSQRKAREGRNPRTNEKITIPASKNVRFKAGKDLREAVNTKRAKKR